LQAQQCSPTTAHEEGEKQNLIHILSLAAQAKGWVSLRWKWRVSFAWKLTVWHTDDASCSSHRSYRHPLRPYRCTNQAQDLTALLAALVSIRQLCSEAV
ncbi:hypothetical protein, partial [Comamonas aquatica]|uniref:hypothetical protein n=1 Tax=Comamonas aquatica TaxID=225991 RepID=UPI001E35602B